jgi:Flp pilus assembly protein TadG
MVTRSRKRRRRLGNSGQALVEFAIVAPILLLLIMGIVDFGRAFYTYYVLVDAAREGGRVAAVHGPGTTLATVRQNVFTLLDGAGLDTVNADVDILGFGGTTATPVTVSIAYPFQIRWITPFLGWTGAQAAFTMNSFVNFRNE